MALAAVEQVPFAPLPQRDPAGRAHQRGVALAVLLLAWWPLSLMERSLGALVIGIVLLDLGGQALHVTSQSLIFRTRPEAHSRLVGLYMLFYAVGSGLGAIGTTITYAYAGWQGVCLLGAAVSLTALLFWWLTWRATSTAASRTCSGNGEICTG